MTTTAIKRPEREAESAAGPGNPAPPDAVFLLSLEVFHRPQYRNRGGYRYERSLGEFGDGSGLSGDDHRPDLDFCDEQDRGKNSQVAVKATVRTTG